MQVLIDFDEETLRRLEKVAPGRSRQRSAFIRAAVRKALWELEEEKTRRAYVEDPDVEPTPFDPAIWEPLPFGGFDPPVQGPARASEKKKTPRRRKARTGGRGRSR